MDNPKSLRRYFAEGLAIVVSILIAFGIDASWDRWQESREEQRILRSLHAELVANRDRLAEKTAWHEDVESAIRSLLEASAASTPDLSGDSIDVLIGNASWFNNASTFEMAASDGVVLGGRLSIIDDEALRNRITGWSREVERVARTEVQDYDTFSDVWMPFLRDHAYLPQIHNALEVQPGSGEGDYIPDVPLGSHVTRHDQLLQARDFQNVLLHRLWVQGDILHEYEGLLPRLESLLELLEVTISD